MKVHLKTLGCRLNQAELDQMARQLAANGHHIAANAEEAETVVLNTCAVTSEAVRSSRQAIHQLHRANPNAQIAVTGCYAHLAPDEIRTLPGVSHVADNLAKESLVSHLTGQPLAELQPFDHEPIQREALALAGGRTRAFLKVQDGCDRHCSFCITKVARGRGRSRTLAEIVQEAHLLLAMGYRELVLTGVHLGSYGHDLGQPDGLLHLVRALLEQTDLARLRLSSLEPWGIPAGFFSLWQDSRLCRHLHLPLQSGCDSTLKRMIRRTSQAEFRALVAEARAQIPNLAIATDVIVGFPGETEAEFAISQAFIAEMNFAAMHLFRYSARPDTAAARLPNHLSDSVKRQRMSILQALAADAEAAYAGQHVGRLQSVLWEGISGVSEAGYLNSGYTDNYLRVQKTAASSLSNQITMVEPTGYDLQRRVLLA
jgi:threonylcarbamoyladenosine tRNA methylthiotransferase MtaB